MGAFTAGIKLLIAEIVIGVVMFFLQLVTVFAVAAVLESGAADQLEQVFTDPGAATALPVSLLALLGGMIVLTILLQGFIVNRLWGWE